MTASNYILKEDIEKAISMGLKTIKEGKRNIRSDIGWHQHLGKKKIGVVASSMGILLLEKHSHRTGNKSEILNSIARKQIAESGWGYVSNLSNAPNVESTCWAIQALNIDAARYSTNIQQGIDWIFSQINVNFTDDEGWGFIKNNPSRTYITSFVLLTFHKLEGFNRPREEQESALHWLIQAQNEDGGWGETAKGNSTIFHTAYVIQSLMTLKSEDFCNSATITKGMIFLDKAIKKCQWDSYRILGSCEYADIWTNNRFIRLHFYHFTIPYIIMAFIKTKKCESVHVFEGIKRLIKNNCEGYWKHPYLEDTNIKPIWAIYDSLESLQLFKNNFTNWKDIVAIKRTTKLTLLKGKIRTKIWLFINKYKKRGFSCLVFLLILTLLAFFPYLKNVAWDWIKTIIPDIMKQELVTHKDTILFIYSYTLNISASIAATYIFEKLRKKNVYAITTRV